MQPYNYYQERIWCGTMKLLEIHPGKAGVIVKSIFIFIWLSVLSVLSVTDTYYSVYVLCGAGGLLCLMDHYRTGSTCTASQKRALYLFAGLFSASVVLANYALFEPLTVLQNVFDFLAVEK